jgi:hypothetical protein
MRRTVWSFLSGILTGFAYGFLADCALALTLVACALGYGAHQRRNRPKEPPQPAPPPLRILDDVAMSEDGRRYPQTMFEVAEMLWKRNGTATTKTLNRKRDQKP